MYHQQSELGCPLTDIWDDLPAPPSQPPSQIVSQWQQPPNSASHYIPPQPPKQAFYPPQQSPRYHYKEKTKSLKHLRNQYRASQAQGFFLQNALLGLMQRQKKQWKSMWAVLAKLLDKKDKKEKNDGNTKLWCAITGLIVAVVFLAILVIVCMTRRSK